ncbi:MAG TPA: shikimate kinase [Ilumatobacteraceae bacterium]|nr:shikimate kinase [Ilumatobacteraceae bacterium]
MSAPGPRHLVLVGMMGVGKSTVGRAVAAELGRPLFDSDEMIEAEAGRTVREIWTTDGEPTFRALETQALVRSLAVGEPSVIAAAGGVVLSERNRQALQSDDACVVWLRAEVDVLLDRVRSGAHRPLLDTDPEATLRRMYDERAPLYQEVADAVVSVDHRSVGEVTRAVLRCCA